MTNRKTQRIKLLVLNEPYALRINRGLATEIGFDDSILFLQIEYLIGINGKPRDGSLWICQNLESWKKMLPWWSGATISRIAERLEKRELIHRTARYNSNPFDRTLWFALNPVGIRKLKSVHLLISDDVSSAEPDETPTEPEPEPPTDETPTEPETPTDETSILQNETHNFQNDELYIFQNENSSLLNLKTPFLDSPSPSAEMWEHQEGEGGTIQGINEDREATTLTFDETTGVGQGGECPPVSAAPPTSGISREEFVSALQKLGVNYAARLQIQPTRAAIKQAKKMAQNGSNGGAIYNWLKENGATLNDDDDDELQRIVDAEAKDIAWFNTLSPAEQAEVAEMMPDFVRRIRGNNDTPAQANTDYQAAFQQHLDNLKISYALRIEVHKRTVTLFFPTSHAAAALRESKHVLIQLVEKSVGFAPEMQWRVPEERSSDIKSRFVRNQPRGAWGTGVGQ